MLRVCPVTQPARSRDEKQHPIGKILRRPEALERQPRGQALLPVGA